MFKYLILLLMSLTCFASGPKFHFMDCVKIKKGFYKNCEGDVIRFYVKREGVFDYDIKSECRNGSFTESFNENELERCFK